MKYNEETRELYTDKGEFIKKMNCPEQPKWDNMKKGKHIFERTCEICNKSVIDTNFLTDEEVLFVVEENNNQCLKIDLVNLS